MTALTPAQRQQRKRDKKAANGLVKVEIYCRPDQVKTFKSLERELAKTTTPIDQIG